MVELKRPTAEASFSLLGSEIAVGYVLSILKAAGRFTRQTDVPLISRKDADTFIVVVYVHADDGSGFNFNL